MQGHDLSGDETVGAPRPTYTGDVAITPHVRDDGAAMRSSTVHFWPGARTGWHRHVGSQLLVITDGDGVIANADGTVVRARPGVMVSVEPGELHWHGASEAHGMTHLEEFAVAATTDDENLPN
jgi:quercetin dioxygenase-like cupin family protein